MVGLIVVPLLEKIGKYRRYIAYFLMICFFPLSMSAEMVSYMRQYNQASQPVYGATISEMIMPNGVMMDKVLIYPQEHYQSDAIILRTGLLARHKDAQATVLICHGFMCDQYDAGFLRKLFKKSRFNVMTFDFRAHGKNGQGHCCTFGRDEALDVIAAARFLRNHPALKGKPLFVYGFSMGAVSAIEAQSIDHSLFDAMILDCPFDSSEEVIKTGLDGLTFSVCGYQFELPGRSFLEKYAFHPYVQSLVKTVLRLVSQMDATRVRTNFCPVHPVESIKKITVPCFFIHCKNDEKVSVAQVKAVYSGAAGYKKLWLTNGRRHCDSFIYSPEWYSYRIREFCSQVMDGTVHSLQQEEIFEDGDEGDSDDSFYEKVSNEKYI